ncbi:MAG: hypothetical protein MI744_06815 [Pseudomonadales bacterium]|nr:hypothetical protein [Pseudomonadales bacterium]
MNHYFYLIHPFLKSTASLQLPLLIEAPDLASAKKNAQSLRALIKKQFDLLFEPSDPVLVIPSVNEARFDAFMDRLKNGAVVTLNLPVGHSFNFHQLKPHGQALQSIQALVLVPGNQSSYYSL